MVQRGEDLLVNQLVGFMKDMSALGMADYHVSDAVSVEHRGRHFAGERALVLEVHVLRAQQNRRSGQRLCHRRDQNGGRRNQHVATPEQAESVHGAIRGAILERYGREHADAVRIIYGGSVNDENVDSLVCKPDIDGALVGGASLKADSFARIVKARTR